MEAFVHFLHRDVLYEHHSFRRASVELQKKMGIKRVREDGRESGMKMIVKEKDEGNE